MMPSRSTVSLDIGKSLLEYRFWPGGHLRAIWGGTIRRSSPHALVGRVEHRGDVCLGFHPLHMSILLAGLGAMPKEVQEVTPSRWCESGQSFWHGRVPIMLPVRGASPYYHQDHLQIEARRYRDNRDGMRPGCWPPTRCRALFTLYAIDRMSYSGKKNRLAIFYLLLIIGSRSPADAVGFFLSQSCTQKVV